MSFFCLDPEDGRFKIRSEVPSIGFFFVFIFVFVLVFTLPRCVESGTKVVTLSHPLTNSGGRSESKTFHSNRCHGWKTPINLRSSTVIEFTFVWFKGRLHL